MTCSIGTAQKCHTTSAFRSAYNRGMESKTNLSFPTGRFRALSLSDHFAPTDRLCLYDSINPPAEESQRSGEAARWLARTQVRANPESGSVSCVW